jgi:hypothetical protein
LAVGAPPGVTGVKSPAMGSPELAAARTGRAIAYVDPGRLPLIRIAGGVTLRRRWRGANYALWYLAR